MKNSEAEKALVAALLANASFCARFGEDAEKAAILIVGHMMLCHESMTYVGSHGVPAKDLMLYGAVAMNAVAPKAIPSGIDAVNRAAQEAKDHE